MAKFNFNLRDPKARAETAIHLVIRWNNQRLVFPTKESIHPKFWETDKKKRNFQRAKETKQFPEYPEFTQRLNNIEKDAKDVFRQYQNDNNHNSPSIGELRELLNFKLNPDSNRKKTDLFTFIDRFISEAKVRINDKTGKPFTESTINIYNNTKRLLEEFKSDKKRRIDFDTIDLDFYHDFSEYLTTKHKFATNTIGKAVKTIKTFLNDATERGINTNIAFKSKRFKVVAEKTDSIYLSHAELKELSDLNLSANKKLDKVRDLFLVGCWTGLRFSDFNNIKPENIKGNFIEITTKKTAEPVIIPIHQTVRDILTKYNGEIPPSISNSKMNEYLKDLGELTELLKSKVSMESTKAGKRLITTYKKHELLTTHTARRSFATNLYLDGLSPVNIMKITSHRTEKAFLRYIKITPDESAKILQLHWENQEKSKTV